MEPSFRPPSALPLHHHHYHHHHLIPCSIHHHHHLITCLHHHYHHDVPTNPHLHPSFLFPRPPVQIPQPGTNFPLRNNFNSDPSTAFNEAQHRGNLIFQEQGRFEYADEEEEEEEESVFVLTDEWSEFFAKSEATRRQEKKQTKKKQTTWRG